MNEVYLLIHHTKGIGFADGYGTEEIVGVSLCKDIATKWIEQHKEDNFNRRIYKMVKLIGEYEVSK